MGTRRRFFVMLFAGFLAICAFTLVGVASEDNFLRVANTADIEILDPAFITDAISSRVGSQMFDHLVEYGPDGSIVPGLATSWEFSEDGKAVTFHLREGVLFHDGTPFNAQAVEFGLKRVLDPDLASPHHKKYAGIIEAVEVVDDLTITLQLMERNAAFLPLYMISAATVPVSPTAVETLGEDFALSPVGTGPYKFDEYRPDEHVKLVRFDDFWGGKPPLAGMIFKPIPEPLTRVIELLTGNVDLVLDVPVEELNRLEADPSIVVQSDAMSTCRGLWFHHVGEPFNDPRVRLAFALGLNKDEIFEAFLKGFAIKADSLIPMLGWAHNDLLSDYGYDTEAAFALLEQVGWIDTNGDGIREKNGTDLVVKLITPDGRYLKDTEITNAAAFQWEKLGAKINVEVLKSSDWVGRIKAHDFDITFLGWAKDIPEPALFFDPLARTGGRSNFFEYSNRYLDALIDAGGLEFDESTRAEIYKDAQRILHSDVMFLPIYNDIGYVAKTATLNYTWSASRRHYLRSAFFED